MNKTVVEVNEWLDGVGDDNLTEYPAQPIAQQVDNLDRSGNGIGLVFLCMMSSCGSDIKADLVSRAVFKMNNKWYIITNSEWSAVAGALISTIASTK